MADKRRYIRWTLVENGYSSDGVNMKYNGDTFPCSIIRPTSINNNGLLYFYNQNNFFMEASIITTEPRLRYNKNSGYYPNSKNVKSHWFNENEGYIVGSYGQIYYTTDAGKTVTLQHYSEVEDFNGVSFCNKLTGWVCGNNGIMYKTTDGGINWNIQPTATTSDLWVVYCSDENNVVIIGASGKIIKTTDGTNWSTISTTIRNISNSATTASITGTYLDMMFINSGIGFACTSGGYIIKTTNGGSSWVYVRPITTNISGIYMKDENEIWCCGANKQILKSTNGGVSWVRKTGYTFESSSTIPLNKIVFSGSTGYSFGYDTAVKTTDNGETWDSCAFPTSYATQGSINIFSSNKVYVTGPRGDSLSITEDGAQTWYSEMQETYDYGRIYIINQNHIFFGPDENVSSNFYEFRDNTLIEHNIGQSVHACNFLKVDGNIYGWIYNLNGYVYKTTDSLETWETVGNVDFSRTAYSTAGGTEIYFYDKDLGFIFNTNLFKTTDGGSSWTYISQELASNGCFHFINKGTGWVSSIQKIAKTIDSGDTWRSVYISGATSTFLSVKFLTNGVGYACGTNGVIIKSIDFGETWISLTSNTNSTLRGLDIIDENNIWVCGDGSTIIYTKDGGITWKTYTLTNVFQNLNSINFYGKSGYCVGNNRTLIRLG